MKKKLLLTILLCGSACFVQAQGQASNTASTGWYVGADAGASFGSSTFKSFGLDKTRVGYGGGALVGYHINSFLSAEAELSYRHLGLGVYDCCQNLWLGEDGARYFAPVAGMNSWQYKDIYSSVSLFGLGARLNVDFVRMFRSDSRWSFMISPTIYGMGSKATVKTISTNKQVKEGSSFHFGVGGDLGVGYQVSPRTNIRLYSGAIYLTGKNMDAMSQTEHKSNYTWNSGVKVTFAIGKRKAKQAISQPTYIVPSPVGEVVKEEPKTETKQAVTQSTEPIIPSQQPNKEVVAEKSPVRNVVYQATIYYDFSIPFAQKDSYATIYKLLKAIEKHPDAEILIEAWSDSRGDDVQKNKISLLRATLLKDYLVSQKVAESRITVKGNGFDTNAKSEAKARRAEIKLYVIEK